MKQILLLMLVLSLLVLPAMAITYENSGDITYTAPDLAAIDYVKFAAPVGSTGSFTITTNTGRTVTGSWSHLGSGLLGRYSTTKIQIGTQQYTETYLNVAGAPLKATIGMAKNGSQSGYYLSYPKYVLDVPNDPNNGPLWKFASSLRNVVFAPVSDASPATEIHLVNSPNFNTVDISIVKVGEAAGKLGADYCDMSNALGAIACANKTIAEWVQYAIQIGWMVKDFVIGLAYWLKFLFIDNWILTALLYIFGSMFAAAYRSSDMMQFWRKWFGYQRSLFTFLMTLYDMMVGLIQKFRAIFQI